MSKRLAAAAPRGNTAAERKKEFIGRAASAGLERFVVPRGASDNTRVTQTS